MVDYKRMYVLLFRAVEYAVRLLERGDVSNAVLALKLAQLKCEDIYMESE